MHSTGMGRRLGWAAALLAVAAFGCSSGGKPVAKTSGKVTYNGKEVTKGSITLTPLSGGGQSSAGELGKPASGTLQPDGTFVLSCYGQGDGAVIGKNRVSYSAPPPEVPPEGLKPGQTAPESEYAGLAPKQTEVEIKSGTNKLEIELVKGP